MDLKDVSDIFERKIVECFNEICSMEKYILFCENIMNDLKKNFISNRAKKYFYEKYRLEVRNDNIYNMIGTLENDLFVLRENLNKQKKKCKLFELVKNSIIYEQIINSSLVDFINAELKKDNIENSELLRVNELIRIQNESLKCYNKSTILGSDLYLILNMLNLGYEKIEILENPNAEKLDLIVSKLNELIDHNKLEDIKDNLNLDELYNNIYRQKDFRYIYTEILRHLQFKIWELIDILKQEDFSFDIDMLNDIKNEYKTIIGKYMYFREKIDAINIEIKQEDVIDDENDVDSENKEINNLYYASNSLEPQKCYFMRDLSDIREESLEKIWNLLQDFKYGKNLNTKYLEGSDKYIEIKDDQIRIVLKPLGENNYIVVGVFIKKSDNLRETYQNMFKRKLPELNDEYSMAVENIVSQFVEQNKRSGSR